MFNFEENVSFAIRCDKKIQYKSQGVILSIKTDSSTDLLTYQLCNYILTHVNV